MDGQLQGLVVALRKEERPLQGLAGKLDWHFEGAISRYLKTGFLKGHAGEFSYLPINRFGKVYHLLLVGTGAGPKDFSDSSLHSLQKNLTSLKLERMGVSCEDWKSEAFTQALQKISGVYLVR
jgi:hypothetical protein